MRHLALLLTLLATCTAAAIIAGCGGSANSPTLVVYSGREQDLVGPLFEQFTKDTGIQLDVRYGESAELAATIREEGDASPADVFYAQDAGSVGVLEDHFAVLPQSDLTPIPARFRDPAGRWVGITGRVRVLAYNTDHLRDAQLPASVLALGAADWKLGDIGVAPTNASFVGFVSAMRLTEGDAKTKLFLTGLAGHAKTYQKNAQIIDAIATGEVDTGLVNHYYLYEKLASDPTAPVANHYFAPTDVGSFVNVAPIAILKTAAHADEAQTFVQYLLTKAQVYYANTEGEREYPLNETQPGLERVRDLPPLADIPGPDVDLADLGHDLESTIAMIRDAGLIS